VPRQNTAFLAFNRGIVSRLGLARADLKRVAMSAQQQTNWMPRVLGSMMLRPGLGYLGSSNGNAAAKYIPFVFSITDKALCEMTDQAMRVWVDDELITRAAVSSAVTNGTFLTDLTGWTDADEAGATSAWATGGYMGLTGNGTSAAYRHQTVTVAAGDQGVQHALRVVIERGPVIFRVGTAAGDDSYVRETTLDSGEHSLAFTPTGNFSIQFLSRLERIVLVDSCTVEAAGTMEVPTPWLEADLDQLRWDQSGDVIFVAADGYQQWKIERRATDSWSVAVYQADNGPFRTTNSTPITITPSTLTGNGTLTASAPLFKSTQVGALFALTSSGQTVSANIAAQNTFTTAITVTGVGNDRIFTINITGTWVATVVLQRSLDSDTGPWSDVSGKSWTANTTETFDDGLDNQIAYYRIGVKTGAYTSGTVAVSLNINTTSARGICRITAFSSSTSVSMEVLSALGQTTATDDWEEGEWSDYRGYPTAVSLHESRLTWSGRDRDWDSATDDFYNFDGTEEGDSAFFSRTIGSGPVDKINWSLSLDVKVLGGQGAEHAVRSTTFGEPLTPTNANIKKCSTQGSAEVPAVPIDNRGVYVQRGGTRVYELLMDGESLNYTSQHLTALCPSIGSPGIVRIAVQRQPDTRIHCVRSDGTACVMVYDRVENVVCWIEVESPAAGGLIEDVVVLPGDPGNEEDWVYYLVQRTINGATVRYLEKWAFEAEAIGGTLNLQGDSYVTYTGAATTTITGLGHLEGEEVVVWADGADVGTETDWTLTYTVTGGQITLAEAATNVMVGLPYEARFKSAKLVQIAASIGVPLNELKNIRNLGLIAGDMHRYGLRFGPDFTNLDDLPGIEDGARVDSNAVRTDYTGEPIAFPGQWDADARLCMLATAPRPVTLMSAVMETEV